jgi:hypothetical protein
MIGFVLAGIANVPITDRFGFGIVGSKKAIKGFVDFS